MNKSSDAPTQRTPNCGQLPYHAYENNFNEAQKRLHNLQLQLWRAAQAGSMPAHKGDYETLAVTKMKHANPRAALSVDNTLLISGFTPQLAPNVLHYFSSLGTLTYKNMDTAKGCLQLAYCNSRTLATQHALSCSGRRIKSCNDVEFCVCVKRADGYVGHAFPLSDVVDTYTHDDTEEHEVSAVVVPVTAPPIESAGWSFLQRIKSKYMFLSQLKQSLWQKFFLGWKNH